MGLDFMPVILTEGKAKYRALGNLGFGYLRYYVIQINDVYMACLLRRLCTHYSDPRESAEELETAAEWDLPIAASFGTYQIPITHGLSVP